MRSDHRSASTCVCVAPKAADLTAPLFLSKRGVPDSKIGPSFSLKMQVGRLKDRNPHCARQSEFPRPGLIPSLSNTNTLPHPLASHMDAEDIPLAPK